MNTHEQTAQTEEDLIKQGYTHQTVYRYDTGLTTPAPIQTSMLWPVKPLQGDKHTQLEAERIMLLDGLKRYGYMRDVSTHDRIYTDTNTYLALTHRGEEQSFFLPPKSAGETVYMPQHAIVMIIGGETRVIFCARFGDFLEFLQRYHNVITRLEA